MSATFADGSIVDVTESSNLSYSSSDRQIVTVDARGMVTAVSDGDAKITVTYGSNIDNPLSINIPVTVEPPILTPSPSSLNFGGDQGVFVGTSATTQITLTNTTPNPTLGATSISTSGDFSETDDCIASFPLPAGGTCTISVTFSPTVAGNRTGSLTVANNFTMAPAVIPLAGSANNNFTIFVSPGSQSVSAGSSTSYTVTAGVFDGFSGSITLSAGGVPAGTTATFSPQTLQYRWRNFDFDADHSRLHTAG